MPAHVGMSKAELSAVMTEISRAVKSGSAQVVALELRPRLATDPAGDYVVRAVYQLGTAAPVIVGEPDNPVGAL